MAWRRRRAATSTRRSAISISARRRRWPAGWPPPPPTSLDAARARRDQVLGAMVAAGYLTDVEANHWRARPVIVRQRPDFFHTVSPYFAEQVRRDVARRYGEKKLYEGGLEIETAVVPWIDLAAQENVDFSLRQLD